MSLFRWLDASELCTSYLVSCLIKPPSGSADDLREVGFLKPSIELQSTWLPWLASLSLPTLIGLFEGPARGETSIPKGESSMPPELNLFKFNGKGTGRVEGAKVGHGENSSSLALSSLTSIGLESLYPRGVSKRFFSIRPLAGLRYRSSSYFLYVSSS